MTEIMHQIILWFEGIITSLGYPGVAFATFAENLFPPIPSEIVIPFGGFVASEGKLTLVGVWIASTVGSVLGAVVIYYIGMYLGNVVFRNFLRRYGSWFGTSEEDYDRALRIFRKYGGIVVFLGRVIPLIRTLISVPAGADRMPLGKFLLYTTAGSAIWSGLLAYGGYVLGNRRAEIAAFLERYSEAVEVTLMVGFIIALGLFIYKRVLRRTDRQLAQE